ncbi:MAG: ABC transporter permease, partial [Verrucomicrobiota bacterium]
AALTAFSVGLTIAMQAAEEMGKLGGSDYVPPLVSIVLLRELGPMLIAVIVTGRSGSAVTAELGTMAVSEEIEALTAMAINPIRFLIIPRFIAMLIMLPVLAAEQSKRVGAHSQNLQVCPFLQPPAWQLSGQH